MSSLLTKCGRLPDELSIYNSRTGEYDSYIVPDEDTLSRFSAWLYRMLARLMNWIEWYIDNVSPTGVTLRRRIDATTAEIQAQGEKFRRKYPERCLEIAERELHDRLGSLKVYNDQRAEGGEPPVDPEADEIVLSKRAQIERLRGYIAEAEAQKRQKRAAGVLRAREHWAAEHAPLAVPPEDLYDTHLRSPVLRTRCRLCGREVANYAAARASHARVHVRQGEAEESCNVGGGRAFRVRVQPRAGEAWPSTAPARSE